MFGSLLVAGLALAQVAEVKPALRNGMMPSSANISTGCRVETFSGTDPRTGNMRANDVPLANNLLRPPVSSRVVNNVTVQLGASFQF